MLRPLNWFLSAQTLLANGWWGSQNLGPGHRWWHEAFEQSHVPLLAIRQQVSVPAQNLRHPEWSSERGASLQCLWPSCQNQVSDDERSMLESSLTQWRITRPDASHCPEHWYSSLGRLKVKLECSSEEHLSRALGTWLSRRGMVSLQQLLDPSSQETSSWWKHWTPKLQDPVENLHQTILHRIVDH